MTSTRITLASLATLAGITLATLPAFAETLTFLGPTGTYSDQAARKAAEPHGWDTATTDTIADVAKTVTSGDSAYGLLPIENSTGGYVDRTLALLTSGEPEWRVIGTVTIPIDNTFMAKPGTKPDAIERIYSHPQPFLQSSDYLKANYPDVERIETDSTAAAAKAVAERAEGDAAAIAAPAAAEVYDLAVIEGGIQNDSGNATRFWVVEDADAPLAGRVDRAILLHVPEPGSVSLGTVLENASEAGFATVAVTSLPTGRLDASRYVVTLRADSAHDATDLQSAVKQGPGKTMLIGAYEAPDAK